MKKQLKNPIPYFFPSIFPFSHKYVYYEFKKEENICDLNMFKILIFFVEKYFRGWLFYHYWTIPYPPPGLCADVGVDLKLKLPLLQLYTRHSVGSIGNDGNIGLRHKAFFFLSKSGIKKEVIWSHCFLDQCYWRNAMPWTKVRQGRKGVWKVLLLEPS